MEMQMKQAHSDKKYGWLYQLRRAGMEFIFFLKEPQVFLDKNEIHGKFCNFHARLHRAFAGQMIILPICRGAHSWYF